MKEFFQRLEDYTSVDANTWATIFITIIVFGLGFLFTWIGKKINESAERKRYKSSLNLLLSHFADACKKQSNAINKSLKKTSLIENKDFVVKFPTIKTLTYLSELDLSIFIDYYVRGKNKKLKSIAVTQLFETIGNIKTIQIEAKDLTEHFGKKFDDYETLYRDSLQKIVSLHDNILQQYKINSSVASAGSMDDRLIKIFVSWSKLGEDKNSIYSTYNSLIKPIEELTYEFDQSPNSLMLLDLIIPCYRAYINMKKIYDYLISNYKKYAKISNKSFIRASIILKLFDANFRISKPYSFCREKYRNLK